MFENYKVWTISSQATLYNKVEGSTTIERHLYDESSRVGYIKIYSKREAPDQVMLKVMI